MESGGVHVESGSVGGRVGRGWGGVGGYVEVWDSKRES